MKIGIFGNTNNYPLLLATGLRELGYDVTLVVNRKERLHRPESKYPDFERGYPEWIVDCSDVPLDDYVAGGPRIAEVINHLAAGSSGLVLNDLGPSLLGFCDLPSVAVLTGSDLSYFGDRDTLRVLQQGWAADYRQSPGGRLVARCWSAFIERQRDGIRRARAVSAPLPGLVPQMDALLADIGVPDSRREFFYIADTGISLSGRVASNVVSGFSQPNTDGVSGFSRTNRLRIVNGARLNWKKPLPPGFSTQDHKGTDVLLEGFADFVTRGGDAELVLFRKGLHVAETEALAAALGVSTHIAWRGEMTLNDFYTEISGADIVCDQLGDAFPGLVALDAMALGLPVIANFRPESIGAFYPEPLPAFQARSAHEVSGHLSTLAASREARRTAGERGRTFAREYLSPAANAARCVAHLGVS